MLIKLSTYHIVNTECIESIDAIPDSICPDQCQIKLTMKSGTEKYLTDEEGVNLLRHIQVAGMSNLTIRTIPSNP